MTLTIEEVNVNNENEWEDYVNSKDETTFVDSLAWRKLAEKVYKLSQFWYMAKNNGKIEGILALTLSKHPLFGKYLASAPFANQGGFYADSESSFNALLDKAIDLRHSLKARYASIRHLNSETTPPDGWQQDTSYATYHLPLKSDPELFFKEHLRSKTRNKISKSMKYGFKVQFGRFELLDAFWYVISHSMKELGSPYHSKFYLETLLELHGFKSRVVVLYTEENSPVGCALLINHLDTAVLLHANCLEQYRSMRPRDFLYWSVISECCREGMKWLDMGRSLIGSGNENFKMRWRPIRHSLAYWYNLSPGEKLPGLNQENPRFQKAIKIWQGMPLWLIRMAGPRLISGIL